jgi:hypothetical protein
MKLLTTKQRTFLTQLARRAWKPLSDSAAIEESFDAWRQRIATRACGHTISTAPISAFDDLFIEFKAQAGETDEAFERAKSNVTNAQRSDIHNIKAKLAEVGWSLGYALKIANDGGWQERLGLLIESLEQLPATATRNLLYTITNRVAAEKRKRAARA